MKISKIIIGAIAAATLALVSCEREQLITGESKNLPAPQDVVYDVENEEDGVLAVKWNAAECISAGVATFSVYMSNDTKSVDNYNTASSLLVQASDIKDGIGRISIPNKSRFNQCYIRVRANYKGSAFSEWVWAETNGEKSLLEAGVGMLDSSVQSPQIELKEIGADKLSIKVSYDATQNSSQDSIRLWLFDYTAQTVAEEVMITGGNAGEKTFEGLKSNKLYQVKIRCEHRTSPSDYAHISNWSLISGTCMTEDPNWEPNPDDPTAQPEEIEVETDIFRAGEGWAYVNGVPPASRIKTIYSSMLVFEWSKRGFTDKTADANDQVYIALWKDADASELVYGWTINSNIFNGIQPCFTFANLTPGTNYWFTVKDLKTGLISAPLMARTSDFQNVQVTSAKIEEGGIALAENFSELYLGGNSTDVTPSVVNGGQSKSYPTVGSSDELTLTNDGNHGFFNTLGGKSKLKGTRFEPWAVIHGLKDGTGAVVPGDCCIRTGMLQMGASSGIPILFTPELTNLKQLAEVTLTLTVCAMAEKGNLKECGASDFQKLGIYTIEGASKNSDYTLNGEAKLVAEIDRPYKEVADSAANGQSPKLLSKQYDRFKWETKKVKIRNVKPGARIGIGAIRPNGKTGNQRFLLREVSVMVNKYAELVLETPKLEVVEVKDVEFTVKASEQELADSYRFYIQKCGESSWTEVEQKSNICKFESLTEDTEYHVKVVAINGSSESNESTAIVVKTAEPEQVPLATPSVTATPAVKTAEITWQAVEKATSYKVYLKSAADADWVLKAENLTATNYEFTGLDVNTAYSAAVEAIYKTNVSAKGTVEFTTLNYTLPTEIGTADDFIEWLRLGAPMATDANTLTLTADIDLSGKEVPFAETYLGTLDGAGHSIKNLQGTKPIFGTVNSVKNLTIDASCSFNVEGSIFGTVAQVSTGLIDNVHNKANVTKSATSFSSVTIIAGVVGVAKGDVKNCSNTANISATTAGAAISCGAAGVVGYLNAPMTSCTNSGNVTLSMQYNSGKATYDGINTRPCCGGLVAFGGIVGTDGKKFEMTDCTNSGKVSLINTDITKLTATAQRQCVGGIVGGPHGDITNCTNSGEVYANLSANGAAYSTQECIILAGGICGADYYVAGSDLQNATNIYNCENTGAINVYTDANKSNSATGGIVGWPCHESTGTVITKGCINKGNVTISGKGKMRAGGVQGGSGNIELCENHGTITVESADATSNAGSLAGFHSNGYLIKDSKAFGKVEAKCAIAAVGGLTGLIGNATHAEGKIAGCEVNCELISQETLGEGASSYAYTGLLIGKFNGNTKEIHVGTETTPIKVNGKVNGVAATTENVEALSHGSGNYTAGTHVLHVTFE